MPTRRARPTRSALLLLAALPLAGCDLVEPGDDAPEKITALPRALTVAERAVIESGNAFGLDLLREVAARDDRANVVLSPFSASMALGMTLNGADGATFEAMRTTLGFAGLDRAEINASYSGLIELLTTLDPTVRFDVANSVWSNEDAPVLEGFLRTVADAFGARTESRDFSDPATLAEINRWVEESTDGYIGRILDSLDPNLVMLLINAIFFEGSWTTEFDPERTTPGDFRRDDGTVVSVPMMSIRDTEFPVGGGADWSAIELPYGGEAFSMVLVVPGFDTTARELLTTLDEQRWSEITESLAARELDVLSMPKLTLTFDAFLNDALRAMGMDPAFRPGADFTRLSPVGDQLCIDFVRQKTFLEVDEEGTRAAAVTAVGIGPTSFNGLIVDRPFLLAIRERLSGTILFFGLIGDPTAEDPGPEPYERTCM